MSIEKKATPEVMTVNEAAKFLRITISQLYDLTRHRGQVRSAVPIPVVRFAKQLRFRKSALESWMTQLEQQTA
jgi:excisionase family DNA binding protein